MLNKEFITVREFAKLIGKLIASEHGVLYAPLFYKTLEIQKDFELKINKGNFDRKMKLSKESIDCVNGWILNLPYSFKPIVFKSLDRKIESDSSMIGYGAHDVTNNSDISSIWSKEERQKHINYLELKAAFLALKQFCENSHGEHVQLFLDNTTAIKYLNKMGGRKTSLNRLAKQIWLWCMHRKIWLSVFFIKGMLNTKADALSRQKLNADMEWMIVDNIFAQIMDKFGPCDVDLFASKYNYRLDNGGMLSRITQPCITMIHMNQDVDAFESNTQCNIDFRPKKHYIFKVIQIDYASADDDEEETGWTPLMIAASAGRYQIILMLIRNGAQVNAVNQTGQCSLHYAASKNRYEIAEMLLQQGADPDIGDQYNNTPLHRAASKGHVKLVKLLLQYNVDVNYRDSQNSTPLHWACEEERGEVAQLLVDRGADIAALNKEEKTPLDFVSASFRRSLENKTIRR
ncbi:PSMD10 [Mytilus coruscus]|uniref:PSMD10 n=1 Tax=Mytilus coruscus TaxID=42192 RepID=A0A6J8BEZ0_MYTCO|nr:PSMD10 [Mytilus coruscus]